MANFLFIVQGEGKGHLTQAISLAEILHNSGHKVVATMVGTAYERKIPAFYTDSITAPLYQFESPSLHYGKGKAPNIAATVIGHGMKANKYIANANLVHEIVERHQPDAIINFYELAAAIYNFKFKPKIPTICIGHQYLLQNKHFQSIKNKKIDQWMLNLNTTLTGYGSTKKLALSFTPMPNDDEKNIVVVPPLLRNLVKKGETHTGDYILAYVTHYKIAEDIMAWQAQNKHIRVECFIDKKKVNDGFEIQENMYIHKVNAEHFLDKMKNCMGLVSTAGFESVCEAMYLGKPVLMVPVKNHIEQRINAHDGERAGAGIYSKKFKIEKLINYIPNYKNTSTDFRTWEKDANRLFLNHIEEVIFDKVYQNATNNKPKISTWTKIKKWSNGVIDKNWGQLLPS
ncbi:MAG: glycosyl transferase [Pseudarcicella sp.]|nr:glycosyl transferase [Pseudarcicella sp.]MBP6410377.1 glycosyl transferase [Pseudarcicella sp.]